MRLLAAPFPVDAVGTILKISRPCTAHSTVDPGHSHIRLPYCRSQICLMTAPVRRSVHLMTGSQVEHPVFFCQRRTSCIKGSGGIFSADGGRSLPDPNPGIPDDPDDLFASLRADIFPVFIQVPEIQKAYTDLPDLRSGSNPYTLSYQLFYISCLPS